MARRPKNALSLQDDDAGNPLSAPGDISEAAEVPPIGSSGWAANFRPSTNIEDRRGQDPEIARMWGIVNRINGADANGAVNFMQRPGYNDPYKPMSPADVWEWHKQNAADAWKAAQDPQTWRDAAQQYGQALIGGTAGPEFKGIMANPAFRQWFGASKLVGEDGMPLVVYHGTNKSFPKFDPSKGKAQTWGDGFYFSKTPEVPNNFAGANGGNVIPAHIRMEKPFVPNVENVRGMFDQSFDLTNKMRQAGGVDPLPESMRPTWLRAQLDAFNDKVAKSPRSAAQAVNDFVYDNQHLIKAAGHDGIVDGNEIVAFDPNQIKSAIGNRGTFSPTDPRITYGVGGLSLGGAAAAGSQQGDQ